MTTTYFSIDVESTGTNPHNKAHKLISVGAQVVHEDGLLGAYFYSRLRYPDSWDPETKTWWLQQNQRAKDEVFSTTMREATKAAALRFAAWVTDETIGEACFVANPSTFDHSWVQRWLTDVGLDMPFTHRTLCLRSADWGRNPSPWGGKRTGHTSLIPHHALFDAQAQALDLLDLLRGAS